MCADPVISERRVTGLEKSLWVLWIAFNMLVATRCGGPLPPEVPVVDPTPAECAKFRKTCDEMDYQEQRDRCHRGAHNLGCE